MTTHNWGEMAPGLWTLEIDNDGWDGTFVLFERLLFFFKWAKYCMLQDVIVSNYC